MDSSTQRVAPDSNEPQTVSMSSCTALLQCGGTTFLRAHRATLATAMAAFLLLMLRATTTGLLCDELLFVHAIDLGSLAGLCAPGSSHPPLLRLVVGAFADSGSPDWLLRLPSVLCSVGCVFVWSGILRRLIADRSCQSMLLPAMALNPVFVELGFQCLPYAPLMLFASLHCRAWLRWIERETQSNTLMLVCTGVALPWTHFFGIHVLLADQLIWLALLWHRRTTLRRWLRLNLVTAALTLPVVPVALYYMTLEGNYSIMRIADFRSYFFAASSMVFNELTFAGFGSPWPTFAVFYAAAAVFTGRVVLKQCTRHGKVRGARDESDALLFGGVAIAVLLAGLPIAQLHSVVSQKAFWPRYAVAGSWLHQPVIVLLTMTFAGLKPARVAAALTCCLAVMGIAASPQNVGTDYDAVCSTMTERWQNADAFVAQGIDMWDDANHFDRLWFRRYADPDKLVVSGPPTRRHALYDDGLRLESVAPAVRRVWVYSHLFKRDWLLSKPVPGWRLREIYHFRGPFPLALFERAGDGEQNAAAPGEAAAVAASAPVSPLSQVAPPEQRRGSVSGQDGEPARRF